MSGTCSSFALLPLGCAAQSCGSHVAVRQRAAVQARAPASFAGIPSSLRSSALHPSLAAYPSKLDNGFRLRRCVVVAAEDGGQAAAATEEKGGGSAEGSSGASSKINEAVMAILNTAATAGLDPAVLREATDLVNMEFLALEAKVLEAANEVAKVQADLDKQRESYMRLNADFDNFRKRTQREKETIRTTAKGAVVEELLPMLDTLEAAKTQVKATTEGEEKIARSYQGVYNQTLDIMRRMGLVRVETVGKPFDPAKMDAIMKQETDEVPDGTVLEEYRAGFMNGDMLLRPAMVKVASNSSPAPPPASADAAPPPAESS